jgi:hypothetical protein
VDGLFDLAVPLVLLIVGYFAGTMAEQSHYKSIRVRELRMRRMPTTNLKKPPAHWRVEKVALVAGSTVISWTTSSASQLRVSPGRAPTSRYRTAPRVVAAHGKRRRTDQ